MKAARSIAITFIQAIAGLSFAAGLLVPPAAAAEAPAAAPSAPGPHTVMEDLSARLFADLDKQPISIRHNADKVLPLLDRLLNPHFDREYAARLVLGQHWRSATQEQRQKFADALYRPAFGDFMGKMGIDAYWDRFGWPSTCHREASQVICH